MPKKVRSAKGVVIDFDLMQIKQQLESAPKPLNVEGRRNFIDDRLRRRSRKVKKKLEDSQQQRNQRHDNTVDVNKKFVGESTPQQEKIAEVKNEPSTQTTKKRKIKKKTINYDTSNSN